MRSITLYDKNGDPFCYTEDDCHIYDFDGNPIAYIENDCVWNYDGKHLGFMHNGWIIDLLVTICCSLSNPLVAH